MRRKRGRVQLTGSSLLAHLPPAARSKEKERVSLCRSVAAADQSRAQAVFGSQVLHEATMYYPMRSVRTSRYCTVQYSTVLYSTVTAPPGSWCRRCTWCVGRSGGCAWSRGPPTAAAGHSHSWTVRWSHIGHLFEPL